LKHKHGWARPDPTARPDHEVGSFLGVDKNKSRVTTPDGKINLAPAVLVQAVRNLELHAVALQ